MQISWPTATRFKRRFRAFGSTMGRTLVRSLVKTPQRTDPRATIVMPDSKRGFPDQKKKSGVLLCSLLKLDRIIECCELFVNSEWVWCCIGCRVLGHTHTHTCCPCLGAGPLANPTVAGGSLLFLSLPLALASIVILMSRCCTPTPCKTIQPRFFLLLWFCDH